MEAGLWKKSSLVNSLAIFFFQFVTILICFAALSNSHLAAFLLIYRFSHFGHLVDFCMFCLLCKLEFTIVNIFECLQLCQAYLLTQTLFSLI
jgi:hypothetical protein